MRVRYHIAASAAISLGVQITMHSQASTLACFLSGILIDGDHYVEYCLVRRKLPSRYQDLVDFFENKKEPKLYLLLHSYELLILLWLSIYYFSLGKIYVGIAIGLTTHLLLDQFTNPIRPYFYFLFFRVKNSFLKARTLSKDYFSS